jgi:hypothetical protein
MKERQIEAMYRARFHERRRATEVVDSLYAEAAAGRDTAKRAWLIAVAHPRIPGALVRLGGEDAQVIFKQAEKITLSYSNRDRMHPLENIDRLNPRPGLRRWVAPNSATGDSSRWREAWASAHHDGSITLAAAVGGHRKSSDGSFEGWEVAARAIEAAVADFTALIRATAAALHHGEYDVCIGVVWTGEEHLKVLTVDGMGFTYDGVSTPLSNYSPVRSTVDADASDAAFHRQVHRARPGLRESGWNHSPARDQGTSNRTRGALVHGPVGWPNSRPQPRRCAVLVLIGTESASAARHGACVGQQVLLVPHPEDVPALGDRSHRPAQPSR